MSCSLLLLPNMQKEKFLLFCCVETSLFHDLEAGVEPESWWARYKALPFCSSYLWSFMPELWSLLRKSIRWLCHHLRLSQSIWLYTDSFPSFQIITWNPTVILNMTPYRFSKIRCCFVIRLQGLSVLDTRGNSFLVEKSGSVIGFALQEQCLPGTVGNCVMLKNRLLDKHLENTLGRVVQHFLQFNFTTQTYATKLFPLPKLEAEPRSFYFSSFSHLRKKTTDLMFLYVAAFSFSWWT